MNIYNRTTSQAHSIQKNSQVTSFSLIYIDAKLQINQGNRFVICPGTRAPHKYRRVYIG